MPWNKIGRIISNRDRPAWMKSHAMVPVADHVADNRYRIYFSSRDDENRSMIGYALIDLADPFDILEYSPEPVLNIGKLGCFDDNGVTPSCILNHAGRKYLFYIGWKPRSTTRMSLQPGLAVSDDGGSRFTRLSRAPILHRTDREPFSILTAPWVIHDGGVFRMWYVSCECWISPDLPMYNIKYAHSPDAVNWTQTGRICIDFDPNHAETALARPCVLREAGIYKMWYSYKRKDATYRIGYAESTDGLQWQRRDQQAGIDVATRGWDSEMIEYAFVFNHGGRKYMLYNGNGYGTNGVGMAVASDA